jgi:hypothetical protein
MSYTVVPNVGFAEESPRRFPFAIMFNGRPVAWCETEEAANNLKEDLTALTKEHEEAEALSESGKN